MAGGGDYDVHPSGLRPFTLRELACIQGFPMDYQFVGNWGEKKRQVGNAVPPVFGAAVMMEVRKTMERCDLEREEQRKRAEERREEEEEEGKDEGKEEEGGEQVRQLEDEIQVYEI